MGKVFLLNIKMGDYIDVETHTIIFADEEKAKNIIKRFDDRNEAENFFYDILDEKKDDERIVVRNVIGQKLYDSLTD